MASNQSKRGNAVKEPAAKPAAEARVARGRPPKPEMADRRSQIIAVATRRFAEFGFEATTVRQIADDVSILSGSLYHHFATKDEILDEIVRDAVLKMRDNSIRISLAPFDAEHRLVALILLDLGELTQNQEIHAILNNERRFFRRSAEFDYVVKAKKDAYLAWKTVIDEGVKEGLFDGELDVFFTISTIVRMLNVAADWYKNEGESVQDGAKYTLDHVKDFHIRFILNAVRAPHRTSEPIPRQACEELARFRN